MRCSLSTATRPALVRRVSSTTVRMPAVAFAARRKAPALAVIAALLFAACADTSGPALEHEVLTLNPMRDALARKNTRSYVVTLQPRVSADAVARDHGVEVDRLYTHVLNGFSGRISDLARSGLLKDVRVRRVELNGEVKIVGEQDSPPWGLDRIDQRSGLDGRYGYTTTGRGVTAYIVDTGIRYSHSEFGGRARPGYSYFFGDGADCHGHGTHVAGTIGGTTFGVAKDAALVSVAVLTCYGSGTLEGVIAGLDWIAANAAHPAVVNMSLGGGASETLDEAVRTLIDAGVTVVIAAGNSNVDACGVSPAREPAAITIAATDAADRRASWSNWGACVDLFAPGVAIESAGYADDAGSVFMSGTSMAAPHTAGAAALVLERQPFASPAQVADALRSASTRAVVLDPKNAPADLLFTEAPSGVPTNTPPVAEFAVSCTALHCTFADASADPGGSVVGWRWEFGDGQAAVERNPDHTYAEAGSYTVSLVVTDDAGATAEATRAITLSGEAQNAAPTASFTVGCDALQCDFVDTSSDPDGTIVGWTWDFGDGTTLSNQSSSHEFPAPGTYVVALTVTDDHGATGSGAQSVTVTVGNAPPVATFVYECTGLTCRFTDASTDADGTIQTRHWDLGDGATATGSKPNHTYASPGSFGVRLTVTDDRGATSSASRTVVLTAPDAPAISLTAAPRKVKGLHFVDLAWTGAAGSQIAIYRNDVLLLVAPNNGQYTDATESKGRGDYVYRVCETQASVCSANLSVSLR